MRKIDDSIILQMHEEGKSLKEIAEKFECSKTAISKRLKRLKENPEAPISKDTTEPLDLPEIEPPVVPEKEYTQEVVSIGNFSGKLVHGKSLHIQIVLCSEGI